MPRRTTPRSKNSARKTTAKKVVPVPPGFRTVTPYLAVNGGLEALEFYKKAFGAKELARQTTPDGKVVHARMKIGDSIVMLSDQFEAPDASGATPMMRAIVTLHIYSRDVDKLWQQATAAGAKVLMPIDNMFWGERYGQLVDPFGHRWSVSMQVKMSKEEREAKEKAAMAMFAQDQHAGKPAGTA
jgi:PhnB protein